MSNYWTYEKAKKYMSEHNPHIKTKRQFVKYMQGNTVGCLPHRPNHIYKNNGWVSWGDFLDNN